MTQQRLLGITFGNIHQIHRKTCSNFVKGRNLITSPPKIMPMKQQVVSVPGACPCTSLTNYISRQCIGLVYTSLTGKEDAGSAAGMVQACAAAEWVVNEPGTGDVQDPGGATPGACPGVQYP